MGVAGEEGVAGVEGVAQGLSSPPSGLNSPPRSLCSHISRYCFIQGVLASINKLINCLYTMIDTMNCADCTHLFVKLNATGKSVLVLPHIKEGGLIEARKSIHHSS